MRILSRDFTKKEKILLLALLLVLVALVYYQFVDVPVREALEKAKNEKASLETELDIVNLKVAQLERMKAELDNITNDGTFKPMPSYNTRKNVITLLTDVLGSSYIISNIDVSKSGDLVRRTITMQIDSPDFESVHNLLAQLTGSEYRCLIGDVKYTTQNNRENDLYRINTTVTFYETMVGGEADSGLPQSAAK